MLEIIWVRRSGSKVAFFHDGIKHQSQRKLHSEATLMNFLCPSFFFLIFFASLLWIIPLGLSNYRNRGKISVVPPPLLSMTPKKVLWQVEQQLSTHQSFCPEVAEDPPEMLDQDCEDGFLFPNWSGVPCRQNMSCNQCKTHLIRFAALKDLW